MGEDFETGEIKAAEEMPIESRQEKAIGTLSRIAHKAGVGNDVLVLGSYASGTAREDSDADLIFLGKDKFDKFREAALNSSGLSASSTDWESIGISRQDYRLSLEGQDVPIDVFYADPNERNGVRYWEIQLPQSAKEKMGGKQLGIPESGIDGGVKGFDGVDTRCISSEYTLATKLESGLEKDQLGVGKLLEVGVNQEKLARIQQDAKRAGIALRMPDEVGHAINEQLGLKKKS